MSIARRGFEDDSESRRCLKCLHISRNGSNHRELTGTNQQLFESIRAGDLAGMRSALNSGANVNGTYSDGSTPLMYSAFYLSDTARVRLLLNRGADPNAADALGATALIWGTGGLEKVKLLVEHGGDVNVRSKLA